MEMYFCQKSTILYFPIFLSQYEYITVFKVDKNKDKLIKVLKVP